MDIERMKKLLKSGNKLKAVREVVKTYKTQKQDMYDDTAEILKPSIEVQKEVKKTIDEKQNKLIKQLQENQKALTEGIDKIAETTDRAIMFRDELPPFIEYEPQKAYKPQKAIEGTDETVEETSPKILDIGNIFNDDDIAILNEYGLILPRDFMKYDESKLLNEKSKTINISKKLGPAKQHSRSDAEKENYDKAIQTMKKYRKAIDDVISSSKYVSPSASKTPKSTETRINVDEIIKITREAVKKAKESSKKAREAVEKEKKIV